MNVSVADKTRCCGCGACAQICPKKSITMQLNDEGYLQPVLDKSTCVDCGLCTKVCSIFDNKTNRNVIDKVYAVKNKNFDIRKKSQSGGVFTALAKQILDKNGYVFGAAIDKSFKVSHICVSKMEDLEKLRGSKYVQSDLNNVFSDIADLLNKNQYVLFTGLPCQVYALKSFLLTKKITTEKLYLCDLICKGVPSPGLLKEWLNLLEKEHNSKLKSVSFRDVNQEWGKYREKYEFENGETIIGLFFILLFINDINLRWSCYRCEFNTAERAGDITLGDFWGIEEYYPEFSDTHGVSIVLTNTKKGEELFKSAYDDFDILTASKEMALKGQTRLSGIPNNYPDDREDFWNSYKKFGAKFAMQKKGFLKLDTKYKLLRRVEIILNKMPHHK